jgi:hypothetical protein
LRAAISGASKTDLARRANAADMSIACARLLKLSARRHAHVREGERVAGIYVSRIRGTEQNLR